MKSVRPHVISAVIAAAIIGALMGLSSATASSRFGHAVHACVANSGGAVRFVGLNHGCKHVESSVLIDQAGAPGQTGKTGKTGKTGLIGRTGGPGALGPTGPAGPANSELVEGPVETLSGADNGASPTGEVAVSTATCISATNSANVEAYGGGVNVVTHPQTQTDDLVELQSSYPVEATGPTGATGITGVTGPLGAAVPVGQAADAWSGEAVVSLLKNTTTPDTATVQAYVVCGP
jgi:hypothetical protein